jgi:hypothetical protein
MTTNVLEFPKSAIIRDTTAQTAEKLVALKERSTQKYADTLIHELIEDLLMSMESCGIDVESDPFKKDFIFTTSILSAAIYRSLDMKHPLHDFIDNTVSMTIAGEEVEDDQGELNLEDPEPPPGSTS